MTNPWSAPIGDKVYQVGCPLCGAAKDQPCVYIWPKGVNPFETHHTAGVQKTIDRVGQPTTRAHNERLGLVRDRMIATWRRERRLKNPVVGVSPQVLDIHVWWLPYPLAGILAYKLIRGVQR